jgi:hypothetical protein
MIQKRKVELPERDLEIVEDDDLFFKESTVAQTSSTIEIRVRNKWGRKSWKTTNMCFTH